MTAGFCIIDVGFSMCKKSSDSQNYKCPMLGLGVSVKTSVSLTPCIMCLGTCGSNVGFKSCLSEWVEECD